MTDKPSAFALDDFQAELGAASAALQAFAQGPAQQAADAVCQSFERAGERISRALGSAAMGGEAAFKRLAKVILEEFAKIALQRIFTQSGGKLPFFGGKAAGGAVNAGGAYLVGERGPELFVPRQAGEIAAAGAGAVNVHFHLAAGADVSAVTRHQGQIAAAIARGCLWEAQSVSAFHEVLLPLPFALGASGGPERRVDIVALGSGAEARNTPWAHGRRRYDIGGAIRTLDQVHELIAFFEARRREILRRRIRASGPETARQPRSSSSRLTAPVKALTSGRSPSPRRQAYSSPSTAKS